MVDHVPHTSRRRRWIAPVVAAAVVAVLAVGTTVFLTRGEPNASSATPITGTAQHTHSTAPTTATEAQSTHSSPPATARTTSTHSSAPAMAAKGNETIGPSTAEPVCGQTLDRPSPIVLRLSVGASQVVTVTAHNSSATDMTFYPIGIPYLVNDAGIVVATPAQLYAVGSLPVTVPAGGEKRLDLPSYETIARCGSAGQDAPNGLPVPAGRYQLGAIFSGADGTALTGEYLDVMVSATGKILPSR